MSYSIKHLFHIDASPQKVFEAISTIHGLSNWWTIQTEGSAELNGKIQFAFGEHQGPEMQVVESAPYSKLVWKCTASAHGWLGHTFEFLLDENDGKTRIRFSQNGWAEQDDFFAICNFTWARYFVSLRMLCQTGEGQAFGSPAYQ